ncbi:MAG: S-layer homology domain-containing protein, partial [Firmicutes bacterium]|nr:S-layer homology domain-containing protein [Bacillota bacterium]
ALNEYDIDYAYNSASGYFSSIGDYAEKEHGDKSGWMFMVDGKMAEVAANEYVFSKNATMIWFYTDDYTNDHGSEQFSGGGSGDEEEEDGDDEEDGDKPVFSDVPANHWANEAVTDLAARGIIKGYGNKVFGADDPVKRCDLVAMLYRLSGDEEAAGASYSDVPVDAYYAAAVVWAEKNGIVKGYPDGTFRPENEITREELAAMLYRYAAYKQIELTDGTAKVFKDADAISDYAKDAVDAMTKAGVINGYPDNTFRPTGSATRAETAQMIYALDAMK